MSIETRNAISKILNCLDDGFHHIFTDEDINSDYAKETLEAIEVVREFLDDQPTP